MATKADMVRDFAQKEYIEPARRRGEEMVRIRAGDVHRALNLNNRIALVCSALAGAKFLGHNHLDLQGREGPPSGMSTTVVFTYRLEKSVRDTRSRLAAFLRYRGVGKELFRTLGGGEKFIQSEREKLGKSLRGPQGER